MNATLENWLSYGWLVRHQTSRQEITALLAIADRDLAAAQARNLPADWRLTIAYNAALQAANAALAASGYRAEKSAQHYRVIQSLAHTISLDTASVERLDAFRKKRNISSYQRVGTVSERETEEVLALAQAVLEAVQHWLRAGRPDLLADQAPG
jgi:HEPN domain-containing protein